MRKDINDLLKGKTDLQISKDCLNNWLIEENFIYVKNTKNGEMEFVTDYAKNKKYIRATFLKSKYGNNETVCVLRIDKAGQKFIIDKLDSLIDFARRNKKELGNKGNNNIAYEKNDALQDFTKNQNKEDNKGDDKDKNKDNTNSEIIDILLQEGYLKPSVSKDGKTSYISETLKNIDNPLVTVKKASSKPYHYRYDLTDAGKAFIREYENKNGSPENNDMLKGLTENQKKAVMSTEGDLEVIACAGAGKTKVITLRIINLIKSGVKPENIVAITFTNKAAQEMRTRIFEAGEKYLGNTQGFASMYIGTIDSFCLNMLQEYVPKFAKFSILDDVQIKIFINRYLNDIGFKEIEISKFHNLKGKIGQQISIYSNLITMLNENWYNHAYRDKWDEKYLNYVKNYKMCLYEHKTFDFSCLLREMIEQIDPNSDTNKGVISEFGKIIYDKVKYLIIDEYQDTNRQQEYMVSLFKKYGDANLCIVGDPDQTIYQFRGSDESNILKFKNCYNVQNYIHLNQNFRSAKSIIDIAATGIEHSPHEADSYKRMIPGEIPDNVLDYEEGDTVYASFDNFEKECDFIANRMTELHKVGVPYNEMAILFRKRAKNHYGEKYSFLKELSKVLQKHEIPYEIGGKNTLFETPECKAAKGIFEYLNAGIAKKYTVGKETVYGFFNHVSLSEYAHKEKIKLRDLWEKIRYDLEDRGLDRAIEFISNKKWGKVKYGNALNLQEIYQKFIGYLSILNEDGENEKAESILHNLGKFSKVIGDFELQNFNNFPSRKTSYLISFLNKLAPDLYSEGLDDNAYLSGNGVKILTIHQSKGLEYTAVFIPTLVENIFPGKITNTKPNKLYSARELIKEDWIANYDKYDTTDESERKLFYVAVTRAKKYLFLTYATEYLVDKEEESLFLKEAKNSKYIKPYSKSHRYTKEHLPEFKKEVVPITLNFSLLSDYFDCPYKFKLSSFYGFVSPYKEMQG